MADDTSMLGHIYIYAFVIRATLKGLLFENLWLMCVNVCFFFCFKICVGIDFVDLPVKEKCYVGFTRSQKVATSPQNVLVRVAYR